MTQAAMTRNNLLHQRTIEWLAEHFFEHSDSEPNRLEVHVDLCDKADIYKIYKNEMKTYYSYEKDKIIADNHYLEYSKFIDIWNNVFPWVKIRVYKAVSGKCWVCYWINDIRKQAEDSAVLRAAKRLHQLHRGGLYMLERKRYIN